MKFTTKVKNVYTSEDKDLHDLILNMVAFMVYSPDKEEEKELLYNSLKQAYETIMEILESDNYVFAFPSPEEDNEGTSILYETDMPYTGEIYKPIMVEYNEEEDMLEVEYTDKESWWSDDERD